MDSLKELNAILQTALTYIYATKLRNIYMFLKVKNKIKMCTDVTVAQQTCICSIKNHKNKE